MNHRWPKTPIPAGSYSVEVRCTRCHALSRKTVNGRFYPQGLLPCETKEELQAHIAKLAGEIDRLIEFRAVDEAKY